MTITVCQVEADARKKDTTCLHCCNESPISTHEVASPQHQPHTATSWPENASRGLASQEIGGSQPRNFVQLRTCPLSAYTGGRRQVCTPRTLSSRKLATRVLPGIKEAMCAKALARQACIIFEATEVANRMQPPEHALGRDHTTSGTLAILAVCRELVASLKHALCQVVQLLTAVQRTPFPDPC